MKLVRNAILLSLAVGAASMAGCSSTSSPISTGAPSAVAGPQGGSSEEPGAQTGTVGIQLQLAPGITLSSVGYTITNSTLGGFTTITGTIPVGNSQTVGVTLTLPVGGGFSISLTATDSNGDICAGGPATFTITAGTSTGVSLSLVCSQVSDAGDAGFVTPDVNVGTVTFMVDASLQTTVVSRSACAAATSVVASPNEVNVGHGIALTGAGVDPSNMTSDVVLSWGATGGAGSLSQAFGTTSNFNCTSPGTETVTLTASIADGGASCPGGLGALTIQVQCDAVSDAGMDTGTADTGADTGSPDTGVDTGTPDTGADTGADAGPLAPCTSAGQANCVKCQGSTGGVCTPTEALIVQHDIAKNGVSAAGNDSASSCYTCLFNNGCIDDSQGDVQHECEDSTVAHGTAVQCQNVVSCIFGSDSLSTDTLATGTTAQGYSSGNCSSVATYVCYCGTASLTGSCGGTSSAANGNCSSAIAAGSGFPVSDGTDNLGHFAPDTTYASGMATQIFKCAVNNSCSTCLN